MQKKVSCVEQENTENKSGVDIYISPQFLIECDKEFKDNPYNTVLRNAVVSVGSMLATTDSNRLNDIDHVFMNTLKRKHLKATNQGISGCCCYFPR